MNAVAMRRRVWGDVLAFSVLALGALCMVGPFIWMISTSLKPMAQQYDMRLIPETVTVENYPRLIEIMPIHLQLWNSFFIAAVSTFGQLLTCSMAGFIFAVVRFPFRNTIFVILLVTLMVPAQITVIPQFIVFRFLGLYGTQAPLYLPAFLGGAFGTFLMRQYFLTIPKELAEAARIDGASLARIFFTIYLPLAKPALAAFAIFAFMFSWNDLFNALIYLPSNMETTTVTVGLALFQTQYAGQWPLMMAGSLLAVAPIILVFFLAQRYFMAGISMNGLK
ncbi:carbohydrate ABC transporter permease [Pelagibacterium sp. H642]|uniref:carbohydrate ABC transporter permease n=1 Tax=Pelagibacterium sp. H642 TaxID=1881069 RepID=UPI002814F968|nr:carbohydrate ABC transporter permease [Pelagibacterium sp. H642]WMT92666.1 carbohydrate ABC transporter permease [Pelagibacterium sp. H642]